MMKQRMNRVVTLLATGMLLPSAVMAEKIERPTQPNVVLIVVDDLGWQDVKCYDIDEPSPMETPNMDALAKRGVLFRQAYSPAPVCSPTRAAILSGIHPARARYVGVAGGNPPRPIHLTGSRMITPLDRGSIDPQINNIAKSLKKEGYTTGHCGKWHLSKSKDSPSQPTKVGFDWSRENKGIMEKMTPHRMTGFATREENDPYRLDENGFPRHETSENALTFVRENQEKPFFLYYGTFMVHTPIHTRSKELLDKYVQKLDLELPKNPQEWTQEGQTNPFYCAMVEQVDYYLGQLFTYLNETDDPRWPGHKLSENTYIILTSDNGGMEGIPTERIADNAPLDEGKIHLQEGGVRVPLIITGPGIEADTQSEVMVNGLDFYPTILSLVNAEKEASQKFDGCDLSALLKQDPTDPSLVTDASDQTRDTLMWHFPSSVWMESSIRVGDYKLMRNYDHLGGLNSRWTRKKAPQLELYRLYNSDNGKPVRVDIEEKNDLVESMPQKARELDQRLTEMLTEMNATYPKFNPHCSAKLPHKNKVPSIVNHQHQGHKVVATYEEHGAKVVSAEIIYTTEGKNPRAEWFGQSAQLQPNHKITATLPPEATHYFIYLTDENNFLLSYPSFPEMKKQGEATKPKKFSFSDAALKLK